MSRIILVCTLCFVLSSNAHALASGAPDPGGDEEAAVPLPHPTKLVGFNDDMAGGLHGLRPADYLELTQTAGGNAVRTSLDWRFAEPDEGEWSEFWWGEWQELYDNAISRGMTPIFIVGYAPEWARAPADRECYPFGTCQFPPARSYDDAWQRYVREVATRFPAAAIEVWNEPNLRYFWRSGPDPERFAELLTLAHDAVKSVSPDTTVVAGGLSNVQTTTPEHVAMGEFLEAAYAATPSIDDHLDALALHPYPHGTSFGAGTLFAESFETVREVRDLHGDENVPLFVTEVGIPLVPRFLSGGEQAAGLLRLYRRMMTMDDVAAVLFHRAIEPLDTTTSQFEYQHAWTLYGDNPPTPRPVFCRFAAEAGQAYPGCSATAEHPQTTLGGGPPAGSVSQARAPVFELASSIPESTFECRVDAAPFGRCTSPWATGPLADGPHRVEVRAVSPAGYADATAASRSFTVDTTAPATSIESGPSDGSTINDPTPSFALASSEPGSSFECRLDESPAYDCASPHRLEPLADGRHVLRVWSTDPAGNADPTGAIRSFTVDTVLPVTTITMSEAAGTASPAQRSVPVREPAPTFEFTSSKENVRFECRVDDGDYEACESPHRVRELADGDHAFGVRAIDAIGNVEADPPRYGFTIDTTAPLTRITRAPKRRTGARRARFLFRASEPGVSFRCRLNGRPFGPCASPLRLRVAPGRHRFRVRAVDAAGNGGPVSVRRWRVRRDR